MKKDIENLRKLMSQEGIDIYYVPSGDFHSSEYVNDFFKCREFLCGLSGEAGELIVTMDEARLWTDARYFLQAEEQMAGTGTELMKMAEPGVPTIDEYLVDLAKAKGGYVLGFDARVLPAGTGIAFKEELEPLGVSFKTGKDLVDEIWETRPAIDASEVWELPLSSAGKSSADKLADVRVEMKARGVDELLISDLMEVAWLFNLRGADVDYTPVFFAFAKLTQDEAIVYALDEKLKDNLPETLDFVSVKAYEDVYADVANLAAGTKLWLDTATANYALLTSVPEGVEVVDGATPIDMMKAVKNETELKCTVNAHIKDGVAMTKFIYWVKQTIGKEKITELSAAKVVNDLRAEQEGNFDLSFETISAYGPHAASNHYAPSEETDIEIEPSGFLLVDSGGQFMDGTTDITRTIAVGPLTDEMKEHYTLVLKSHIAMARARVKQGNTGIELDTIARKPLRDRGLDFKHGLGHGVGHLLGVHEGPNILRRIAKPVPLVPGMVITDEPGLYFDGFYGIRIENEFIMRDGGNDDVVFENMTFCPYEPEAIVKDLLTDDEIAWLNNYYEEIREVLLPRLETEELKNFLLSQTEAI